MPGYMPRRHQNVTLDPGVQEQAGTGYVDSHQGLAVGPHPHLIQSAPMVGLQTAGATNNPDVGLQSRSDQHYFNEGQRIHNQELGDPFQAQHMMDNAQAGMSQWAPYYQALQEHGVSRVGDNRFQPGGTSQASTQGQVSMPSVQNAPLSPLENGYHSPGGANVMGQLSDPNAAVRALKLLQGM